MTKHIAGTAEKPSILERTLGAAVQDQRTVDAQRKSIAPLLERERTDFPAHSVGAIAERAGFRTACRRRWLCAGHRGCCGPLWRPRIRFFDLPKAPYFGYANRNVALREARGAMIAFAADDDLWFPDHLEKLGQVLTRGAALAYSPALWVSTDGILAPVLTDLELGDELDDFFERHNTLCANCVVYRADSLLRPDAWPEDMQAAADWRLWHNIIHANPGHPFEYCRIPTVLHFSARRKQSRHARTWATTATTREIADSAGWWPAALRTAIPESMTEQAVIAGLMRADLQAGPGRCVWPRPTSPPALLAISSIQRALPCEHAERELAASRRQAEVLTGRLAETQRMATEAAAQQEHELDAARSERDRHRHGAGGDPVVEQLADHRSAARCRYRDQASPAVLNAR